MNTQPILEFWFVQCTPKMWFKKNRDFDALIKDKFFDTIKFYMKTEIKELFSLFRVIPFIDNCFRSIYQKCF